MNTANKLTFLRIFLIPIFMFLVLSSKVGFNKISLVVFIIASLTDTLDGYIARHYNQITNLGKFLDPLADKLLVISALVSFTYVNILSPWVVIIVIGRELMITGFRTIAAKEGIVLAANIYGKIKTIIQMVTIIYTLFIYSQILEYNMILYYVLWGLTTAATVYSGYRYMWDNKKIIIKN
ncbi:MAG TPA: CDP-diacylglycerol--glycerol-3-phosphate 3-phosphatidyltransferase [Clostridiales bacterium]|nr:CDP-diacylglycerol--glycerol-3-phosphate 3-phosphatidyltransferase [Clostridiales bacterium]